MPTRAPPLSFAPCAPAPSLRRLRRSLYWEAVKELPPLAVRWIGIAALMLLAGCPQERPGAEKQIPAQRVPPAMSVEPAPADAGIPAADARPAAEAGGARRP